MAAPILPLDPLLELTAPMASIAPPLSKTEGDTGGNQDFQDSLFTFDKPEIHTPKPQEKALPLRDKTGQIDPKQLPLGDQDKEIIQGNQGTPSSTSHLSSPSSSHQSSPSKTQPQFSTLKGFAAPPPQKKDLALPDKIEPTPLESVEAFLEEEVSITSLSYAMALQEKENQPRQQTDSLKAQGASGEFSALRSDPKIQDKKTASVHDFQEMRVSPKEAVQKIPGEIIAHGKGKIIPITAKTTASPTKQGPLQENNKTKASSVTTTKAPDGKETLHALAPSNGPAQDHSQRGKEDLESEDFLNSEAGKAKRESNFSSSAPSFTEALSGKTSPLGAPSNAQANLTSLQSDTLKNLDSKDVEDAFLRGSAGIDTKTNSTQTIQQATQQAVTQNSLSQNASLQEQVALSIKNNAPKGKTEINLQLRPDSLGRLNIKIDINKEGQTFVVVTAERAETRDLLQQDSRQLMGLLEQSDLDINEGNMSYTLFQDQDQKEFEKKDEHALHGDLKQSQEIESLDTASTSMISLGMSEVQIPRHGGTWQAIA